MISRDLRSVHRMEFYQILAEQKDPEAMLNLAFHYAEDSNYKKAAELINEFTNIGYGRTLFSEDLEKRIMKLPDVDFPEEFTQALKSLFKAVIRTLPETL